MTDDKDPEETSEYLQDSNWEIPGVPDVSQTGSLNNATPKSPSKTSKVQSLTSTPPENGVPRNGPTPQGDELKQDPSAPSVQEMLEETSKSQEEFRKSQELPLNGKKTSLDQLSRDSGDMSQRSQKSRSSRLPTMHRQCQKRFREIIGKRELRNEELEKQQGDLKQRLNILECSMPAVMVWNIWRMSQGSGVPSLKRVLEKQFQGPASGEVYCPRTPSRHFDCRVREIEAERKQAQKRVDEARALWAEKMVALEERNKRLEEARKVQQETQERIQQLTIEAQKLREAASKVEDDGSCKTGECGVIECKKKWLEKVPSSASIKSTDIECLEKLQQLAEAELCMKRQIADLERREEAYMRTLQQADELWSKLQGDAASTMSALQEQLDLKTAANQQMADRIVQLEDDLEKLRARLTGCRTELEKFMSIEKIEALIGRDDDFASVTDQEALAEVLRKHKMVGREDDIATVDEKDILFKQEMLEKDMLARPDLADAGLAVHPDAADLMTGVVRSDLIPVDDAKLGIKPEDFVHEEKRLQEAKDYLAQLGSLSELFEDTDYVCPPDFTCNDLVLTETGLTEEEMTALKEKHVTAKMLLEQMGVATEEPATMKTEKREETVIETVEYQERVEETMQELPEAKEGVIKAEEVAEGIAVKSEAKIVEEDAEEIAPKEEKIEAVEDASVPVAPMMRTVPVTEEAVPVEEVEEQVAVKEETVGYRTVEDEADVDNVLIARNEMLLWQSDVDAIRETIAKCADCVVVKKDADKLAEMMATYTGTEVKEVIEEPRERKEEVPAAEIEVQVKPEEEAKPELKEIDVITEEPPRPEDVPVIAEEAAAETTIVEVKDVEAQIIPETAEKVTEVEEPEEKVEEYVAEPAEAPEVPEVAKEPEEAMIPEETPPSVKEEVPVPIVEEKAEEAEEALVEKTEADVPAVVEDETVAPVKVEEVKEPVGMPAAVEEAKVAEVPEEEREIPKATEEPVEVKVGKEESPIVEEKVEVKEVISPEEKKVDVKEEEKEVPPEKEEGKIPVPEEKAEVEVDTIPEKEEKDVLKEEVDKVEAPISPEEEEIKVEVLPEREEIPVPEEEVEVTVLPEKKVPTVKEDIEEVEVEVLPEEEVSVVKKEIEEIEVEVLPEEVPITEKEVEAVEVKVLPEEEVPIIKEEVEGVEVDVLPKEEVPVVEGELEVEIEEVAVPEKEEVVEVTVEEEEEEIKEIPVEELPIKEIEEVPEEEKVEVLPEEIEIKPPEIEEEVPVEEVEEAEEVVEVPVLEKPEVPKPEVSKVPLPKVPILEEMPSFPCTCLPPPEPPKKIEITQTEVIRTIETIQVVTQTVADIGTQTPVPRIVRRQHQPKIISITKAVDPEPEILERLTGWKKSPMELSSTMAAAVSSQTEKSSILRFKTTGADSRSPSLPISEIIQSLRTEGAHLRPDLEQELKSIHYAGKSAEPEQGKCNCCMCGKTMMSSASFGPRARTEGQQPSSMFKILATVPMLKKIGSLGVDHGVQHESVCPECKIRKLQQTLRTQESSKQFKRETKRPTCDQEICACVPPSLKGAPYQRLKQKIDQSCMAKIPKVSPRADKVTKKDKEPEKEVHCVCSTNIETGEPGVTKRVRCACGDPD